MKEMIYKDTRKQSLLAYGSCMGYHYCVVSQGVFPCSYVELSPDHAYFKQDKAIICHGGITFRGRLSDDLGLPSNTFWIGWDYGHAGNLEDVVAECRDVIDQLEMIKDGDSRIMHKLTKSAIDRDLPRVMKCIDNEVENSKLIEMCKNCKEWQGKGHDYHKCIDKPCFQFYRCYKYLDWILG